MKFELVHPHYFADHQFCLKCGKWEGEPDANDCLVSHEDWEPIRLLEVLKSERIRLRDKPDEWLAVWERHQKYNK